MIPKLMNAKDVAELLGISESKSYSLMQQGVIPSIRIGRSVRVQEEDLHQYIVRNRTGKNESQLNTKSAAGTTNLEVNQVNPILQKESSHE